MFTDYISTESRPHPVSVAQYLSFTFLDELCSFISFVFCTFIVSRAVCSNNGGIMPDKHNNNNKKLIADLEIVLDDCV